VGSEFRKGSERDSANAKEIKHNAKKVMHDARRDDLFAKGQSRRIWGELYKVKECNLV
jgi:hypothetical protein